MNTKNNLFSKIPLIVGLLLTTVGGVKAQTVTTIQEAVDNGGLVTLDMGENRFQVLYWGTGWENFLWDGTTGYMFYNAGVDWSALTGAVPGQYVNGSWNVQLYSGSNPDLDVVGNVNVYLGDKAKLVPVECTSGSEALGKAKYTYISLKGTYKSPEDGAEMGTFQTDDEQSFYVQNTWQKGLPALPAKEGKGTLHAMKFDSNYLVILEDDCFTLDGSDEPGDDPEILPAPAAQDVLSEFRGQTANPYTLNLASDVVQFVGWFASYAYFWDGVSGLRLYNTYLDSTFKTATVGSIVNGSIAGQWEDSYWDVYDPNNVTKLTFGDVAALQPKKVTAADFTTANRGNVVYSYVELEGELNGTTFTSGDVNFTVKNRFELKNITISGSGKGTIKALYLGKTDEYADNGEVASDHTLQPIEADFFTGDGDNPGDNPGEDPDKIETHSLAWVKAQDDGFIKFKFEEDKVQVVYLDNDNALLWDGTDGLQLYIYGSGSMASYFKNAQKGQYVNGEVVTQKENWGISYYYMGVGGTSLNIELGEVAELVPVERTVAELNELAYEAAHDWDYVTVKGVTITNGEICQGEDKLYFYDKFNTYANLSDYEGLKGNITGEFFASYSWDTSKPSNFYPVSYNFFTLSEVTFSENDDTYDKLNLAAGKTLDATLERTLSADYWSTFCVPFNADEEQVKAALGEGVELRRMDGAEGQVIKFKSVSTLEAYYPYLVKPAETVENPTFENVLVKYGEGQWDNDASYNYWFCGTVTTTRLTTDKSQLFLGTDGNLYYPSSYDTAVMKGLRGYFQVPAGAKVSVSVEEGGVATSISEMQIEGMESGPVFNLGGQQVSADGKALPSGIYVRNGKKFIVK